MVRIKGELSPSGIRKIQKELEEYKNSIVEKCKLLAEKLAQIGLTVAKAKIEESPLGTHVTITTAGTLKEMGYRSILVATGDVKKQDGYAPFSTLLAIEFGAGTHHNPVPNPRAGDMGYGVGTFPGQIHAFHDGWWYWDEKAEDWRYSHGVKATMPMYNAEIEMIQNIVKIAKEVFD